MPLPSFNAAGVRPVENIEDLGATVILCRSFNAATAFGPWRTS